MTHARIFKNKSRPCSLRYIASTYKEKSFINLLHFVTELYFIKDFPSVERTCKFKD